MGVDVAKLNDRSGVGVIDGDRDVFGKTDLRR
jgi:hypothetical protein